MQFTEKIDVYDTKPIPPKQIMKMKATQLYNWKTIMEII